MKSNLFASAAQLLDHTDGRIREFNHHVQNVWSISCAAGANGLVRYSLQLHHDRIGRLKLLAGDVANGLRHSLDHLIADAVKLTLGTTEAEHVRKRVKFPFPNDAGSIDKELDGQRPYISDTFARVLADVFARHARYHYHFRVLRDVSNNSKHWELELVAPDAFAVQLRPEGQPPKITEIPRDHFLSGKEFSWEGVPSRGVEFLTKMQFSGFPACPPDYPTPPCPDTVFSTSRSYVADMIQAFDAVGNAGYAVP